MTLAGSQRAREAIGAGARPHLRSLPGPRHRPPVVVRVSSALLALGALAFAAALMLSDRAPGVLRQLFGDRARRLWDRIDASRRGRVSAAVDLAEPDFVVHVAVWAVAAMLVALAIWTWRGLAATAVGVLAGSIVIEAAQGRLSDTRTVERFDVFANAVGVAIGVSVAALMYLAWSAAAQCVDALRRT